MSCMNDECTLSGEERSLPKTELRSVQSGGLRSLRRRVCNLCNRGPPRETDVTRR